MAQGVLSAAHQDSHLVTTFVVVGVAAAVVTATSVDVAVEMTLVAAELEVGLGSGFGLGFGLKLGGVVVDFFVAFTGCAGYSAAQCSATYGYLKDKAIYSPF